MTVYVVEDACGIRHGHSHPTSAIEIYSRTFQAWLVLCTPRAQQPYPRTVWTGDRGEEGVTCVACLASAAEVPR